MKPPPPSAAAIQAAQTARLHAPAKAKIATENTTVKTPLTAPLTSLAPVTPVHHATGATGTGFNNANTVNPNTEHSAASAPFTGESVNKPSVTQPTEIKPPRRIIRKQRVRRPTLPPSLTRPLRRRITRRPKARAAETFQPSTRVHAATETYHPQTRKLGQPTTFHPSRSTLRPPRLLVRKWSPATTSSATAAPATTNSISNSRPRLRPEFGTREDNSPDNWLSRSLGHNPPAREAARIFSSNNPSSCACRTPVGQDHFNPTFLTQRVEQYRAVDRERGQP